MSARKIWSQVVIVAGLVAMLLGSFDPLEGSLLILPGGGLVAAGAVLGKYPQRRFLGAAFVLMAVGVGAMFGLSAVGGVGGRSGHSMWWLLTVLPYPVGWVMGLAGVLTLVGRGLHRGLLLAGVLLTTAGLGALISLCALRGIAAGMPPACFWLLVLLPHALGLLGALSGGILWIVRSFRTPA